MTKLSKIPEEHIDKCILELRYGKRLDPLPKYVLLSFNEISKALNVKYGRVKRICKQHEKNINERGEDFMKYFKRKSMVPKKQHHRLIPVSSDEV